MSKALELAKFGRETPPTGVVVGDTDAQTLSSKTFSDMPVFSSGTANTVAYLNASKVLSSSTSLSFDGSNLGIGVASPAATLDVYGGASGRLQIYSSASGNFLTSKVAANTGYQILNYLGSQHVWGDGTNTRMVIDTSGNLGINTTSPAYKLEVVAGTSGQQSLAGFRTADATTANNAGLMVFATPSATAASRSVVAVWDADGANSSGGDYFLINKNGNSGTVDLFQYSNAAMRFGANYIGRATVDMTISAAGNLLVGATADYRSGKLVVSSTNVSQTSTLANLQITTSDTQAANVGGSLGLGGQVGGDQTPFGYISGRKENSVSGNYAGYLAFATQNSGAGVAEQLRITSTGNVGIGITNPSNKLVVSNAGAQGLEFDPASGLIQVYNRSTSAYGTMNLYANTLYFRTGSSPAINMTVDVSGNVGIGNSAPTNPLTVKGTGNAAYISSKGLVVDHSNSSTGVIVPIGFSWSSSISTQNPYWGIGLIPVNYSSGTAALGFYIGGNEVSRFNTAGNLGIGTTDPQAKLDVAASSGGITWNIKSTNTNNPNATGQGTGIQLGMSTSGDALYKWAGIAAVAEAIYSNTLGLAFYTQADQSGGGANPVTNPTEKMRLTKDGWLGIGTQSPATRIDVRGASNTAASTVQIVGTSTSTLLLGQNADGGVIRGQGGNNVLSFWTGGVADTGAGLSGTERMRIGSNGDVQITSTSNLGGGKLDITSNATAVIQARSAAAGTGDGTTDVTVTRAVTAGASWWANARYDAFSHTWGYGTSATSNIAMRINGNSNVSIGTTANTAQKLNLNGGLWLIGNDDANYSTVISARYDSSYPFTMQTRNNSGTAVEFLGIYAEGGGAANRIVLGSGGWNVGIGTVTTAPAYKLEVNATAGSLNAAVSLQTDIGNGIGITGTSSGQNSRVGIFFRGSDKIGAAIASAREDAGSTWKTYMAFYTNNLTGANVLSLQEKMRLNADGWLGIGTAAPSGRLSVQGSTELGNRELNTQTALHNTRLSGYALRYDASNRYGSYGQLIFHATDSWTSSARRWMITNGLNANTFAIIRSDGANTDVGIGDAGAVTSGSTDFWITSSGDVNLKQPLYIQGIAASSLYAINIKNTNMTDNSSGFDNLVNGASGGGTSWAIIKDSIINLYNSSGGHYGTWGHQVYLEAGYWRFKGSARLSSTNGAIHSNTSASNYQYNISFRFVISGGPDTGSLRWSTDSLGDGTRVAFSSSTSYKAAGLYTISFNTSGYDGVKQIFITDLELERVA